MHSAAPGLGICCLALQTPRIIIVLACKKRRHFNGLAPWLQTYQNGSSLLFYSVSIVLLGNPAAAPRVATVAGPVVVVRRSIVVLIIVRSAKGGVLAMGCKWDFGSAQGSIPGTGGAERETLQRFTRCCCCTRKTKPRCLCQQGRGSCFRSSCCPCCCSSCCSFDCTVGKREL